MALAPLLNEGPQVELGALVVGIGLFGLGLRLFLVGELLLFDEGCGVSLGGGLRLAPQMLVHFALVTVEDFPVGPLMADIGRPEAIRGGLLIPTGVKSIREDEEKR